MTDVPERGGHYSTERTGPERTGTQHYSTERTTRPQALKCLGTMSASRDHKLLRHRLQPTKGLRS